MIKKNICLVFVHDIYFNNYLYNKQFIDIITNYNVKFLVPEKYYDLVPSSLIKSTDIISSDVLNYKIKTFNLITKVLRWRNRKKSKSFRYREQRFAYPFTILGIYYISMRKLTKIFKSNSQVISELKKLSQPNKSLNKTTSNTSTNIIKTILFYASWFFRATFLRFLIRFLSYNPQFKIFNSIVVKKFRYPDELYSYFLDHPSDLIIFISQANESIGVYLTQIQKRLSRKILFLIDNWDNLSSKSVLWELPDYIATWGEQSSQHAIKIQGFKTDQVFNLGTARFLSYPYLRNQSISSMLNYEYVLFLGSSLQFNEIEVLKRLDSELNNHRNEYNEIKILYRPHPFGYNLDKELELRNFSNVEIDPNVSFTSKPTSNFLSSDYLAALISNSRFIVGGLTSMLIEGSIFGKNIIGLVHKEKYNISSPRKVYEKYEHLNCLNELPNLELCFDLRDLPILFRHFMKKSAIPQNEIDEKLNFFYNIKEPNYAYKLDSILETILQSE